MMQLSNRETNTADPLDKPTLMIVDDERNFAESLRLAMEDAYEVIVAGSLMTAREILWNCTPAAILLDLGLPDGNGADLVQELNRSRRLPVLIIMTAFATVDSYISTRCDGAVDYFTKPIDIVKLKRVLKTELGKEARQTVVKRNVTQRK